MIGIIAAMDVEMKNLRAFMEHPETEKLSGIEFVSGVIDGTQVVTAVCGIGKVAAAMCAEVMILHYRPEAIINTGVAGTLTPELSIGSLVVSKSVVQHDMDTSALGDPIGFISGINRIEIPASKELVDRISACAKVMGVSTKIGIIASGDQFISSTEKKDYIVDKFHAVACEMEGGAVAQVCYTNQMPFCILRAISDSADGMSTMDYPTFVTMAAEQSVKLLRAFLRR